MRISVCCISDTFNCFQIAMFSAFSKLSRIVRSVFNSLTSSIAISWQPRIFLLSCRIPIAWRRFGFCVCTLWRANVWRINLAYSQNRFQLDIWGGKLRKRKALYILKRFLKNVRDLQKLINSIKKICSTI